MVAKGYGITPAVHVVVMLKAWVGDRVFILEVFHVAWKGSEKKREKNSVFQKLFIQQEQYKNPDEIICS